MAQYLKTDVRDRIAAAALGVFARNGFHRATMAGIARAAGISTGNIYHYYRDKNVLFDEVVPGRFVRRLTVLIRRRIRALDGVEDVLALPPGTAFAAAAETLMAFSIKDRLRLIVLLGRSAGTRYEGFAGKLARDLQRQALSYARTVRPALDVTAELRFSLERIYVHWVETMVCILERFETEAEIRAAVASFSTYHLAGLRSLLTGRPLASRPV